MRLTVTGRHVSITEAVKGYAEDKLNHIVDKHLPGRITKAHVIMDVEKYRQTVEVELHGPHANIYGKTASTDMYTSIDKVMDKIERQLVKYKSKFKKLKHSEKRKSIRIPEDGTVPAED